MEQTKDLMKQRCKDDYDYDDYDFIDDISFKSRPKKGQKQFNSGPNIYNIDRSRLNKLTKISLLAIPQRSIDVLSKLVINQQIKEVKRIVKTGTNSVSLQAKVNLNNQNFRDLESDDVIIKVFTQKNHTKSDVKAAEEFNLRIYSEDRNKKKAFKLYSGLFLNQTNINSDDLVVYRIDHIVIICQSKPSQTLTQMIKNNPEKLHIFLREVLQLICNFRRLDYRFWSIQSSINDIYWYKKEWNIISSTHETYNYKNAEKHFEQNLIALLKLFRSSGIARKDLQKTFTSFFGGYNRYAWESKIYKSVKDDFFAKCSN